MVDQEIKWKYEVVELGQAGQPIEIEITKELISGYADAVRNDNPAYQPTDDSEAIAMPTTIMRVAPLRRGDIAANNGFVAQEHAKEDPFQTPFAKCE